MENKQVYKSVNNDHATVEFSFIDDWKCELFFLAILHFNIQRREWGKVECTFKIINNHCFETAYDDNRRNVIRLINTKSQTAKRRN